MPRTLVRFLFGTILALLAPAALAQDEAQETEEVDVVRALGIPSAMVDRILDQVKKQARLDGLPFTLEVSDADGKPAGDRSFVLRWKGGEREVRSDGKGTLSLTLTRECKDGLVLRVPRGFRVRAGEGGVKVSVKSSGGAKGPSRSLDLSRMKRAESGGVFVCHPDGMESEARTVLEELERMRGFLAAAVGFRFMERFGAVVLRGELGDMSLSGEIAIPIVVDSKGELQPAAMYWALVHEWLEGSLVFSTLAYQKDPNLRFVGDGLAELLSFLYCAQFRPEAASMRLAGFEGLLCDLRDSGTAAFDLGRDFPGNQDPEKGLSAADETKNAAGYAASFAFWHEWVRRAGPASLRAFMDWFRLSDDLSLAAVRGKLAELSGREPDLRVDVEEVRRLVAGLK